jgi:hypothetical protein
LKRSGNQNLIEPSKSSSSGHVLIVESILSYGSETWTLTQTFEDRINGCYTQLLRRVLDISWRDHQTNKEVYGDIPPLSVTLRKRRLQFAGHCLRTMDQPTPIWCSGLLEMVIQIEAEEKPVIPTALERTWDLAHQINKTTWYKFVSASGPMTTNDDDE